MNKLSKSFPKSSSSRDKDVLRCPNCSETQWLEGPRGGESVNIECKGCGNRYNDMGPFGLQFLSSVRQRKDAETCT